MFDCEVQPKHNLVNLQVFNSSMSCCSLPSCFKRVFPEFPSQIFILEKVSSVSVIFKTIVVILMPKVLLVECFLVRGFYGVCYCSWVSPELLLLCSFLVVRFFVVFSSWKTLRNMSSLKLH